MNITKEYLRKNPNHIFVFGDNTKRYGKGGAASLRDEPNTYGFITKIAPTHLVQHYYTPEEYRPIFNKELRKLETIVTRQENQDKTYLISAIGSELANKYGIWEAVIYKKIVKFANKHKNVKLLFPVPIFRQVEIDIESRAELGLKKYGEHLRPNNGRSALQDAYEEALDLAMYLKQKIIEEENENN